MKDDSIKNERSSIEEDITELREMIDSDIETVGGVENFNQYCCSVEVITSWIDRVLDIVERINKKMNLDDLLKEMKEKMQKKDLSDEYLEKTVTQHEQK